jgi:hypothetical protein
MSSPFSLNISPSNSSPQAYTQIMDTPSSNHKRKSPLALSPDEPTTKKADAEAANVIGFKAALGWQFEDKRYALELFGKGNYHDVYRFTGDPQSVISFNKNSYPLNTLLLKKHHFKGGLQKKRLRTNRIQNVSQISEPAYKKLESHGVPLVPVYLFPATEGDYAGITLVKKMSRAVPSKEWQSDGQKQVRDLSVEARSALRFCFYWIWVQAKERHVFIDDFKPDNVMFDETGILRVTDWQGNIDSNIDSSPEQQKKNKEVVFLLKHTISRWAMGNEHVKHYLLTAVEDKKLREEIEEAFSMSSLSSTPLTVGDAYQNEMLRTLGLI